MQAVGREQLNALAALRPPFPPRSFVPRRNAYREFDLEGWIRERGVPVKREGPWQRDGYRWILEECPWNRHADNAAYIVRFANGAITAGCHHNSCQGYGWRELREHYEPGTYERQDLIGGAEDANASGEGEGKKPTQAELLTRYADEAELFHTLDGEAYATISVSGHQETHLIKSKGFRHFLVRQFYDEHGKPPGSQALQDALGLLEAKAGTASELRKALGELVDEDVRRSKAWPGAPNALSNCMKRIAPTLREIGIHYSDNIEGHQRTRTKYLRKVEDQRKMSSASSASLAPNEKDPQISKKERGLFADDGQRCGRPADDPVRRDRSQETPAKVPVREDADSADDDLRPHSTADASEVVSAIRQLLDMHPEARQQSPEQIASDLYIWTDLGYELEPSEVEEALKQVLP